MRKKIIGIVICTLLTTAILLPNVGSMEAENKLTTTNPILENRQVKCAWSGVGDNVNKRTTLPSIDLTDVVAPRLEIITNFEIIPLGDEDYGYVKVSNNSGSTWKILEAIQGYAPQWISIEMNLEEWAEETILIRFELETASNSYTDGWFISDVIVREINDLIYTEDFSSYDVGEYWGDWEIIEQLQAPNAPPEPPSIDGPANAERKVELDYVFFTTDPDKDDIYFYVDWGDGDIEDWDGPHPSGTLLSLNHTYQKNGKYTIIAQGKDIKEELGKENTLEVTIGRSRNKELFNSMFLQLLERLLNPILTLLSYFNKII